MVCMYVCICGLLICFLFGEFQAEVFLDALLLLSGGLKVKEAWLPYMQVYFWDGHEMPFLKVTHRYQIPTPPNQFLLQLQYGSSCIFRPTIYSQLTY